MNWFIILKLLYSCLILYFLYLDCYGYVFLLYVYIFFIDMKGLYSVCAVLCIVCVWSFPSRSVIQTNKYHTQSSTLLFYTQKYICQSIYTFIYIYSPDIYTFIYIYIYSPDIYTFVYKIDVLMTDVCYLLILCDCVCVCVCKCTVLLPPCVNPVAVNKIYKKYINFIN